MTSKKNNTNTPRPDGSVPTAPGLGAPAVPAIRAATGPGLGGAPPAAPRCPTSHIRAPESSVAPLELYRRLYLVRRFEELIIAEYAKDEMRTPVHLCIGQEAVAVGVCACLRPDDTMFTTHRGHGHCLAKGASPRALFAELYGRVAGCSAGRGGSMHFVAPEVGVLGTSSIVGGGIPLATGAALAAQMQKTDRVSVSFFGDGAADEGTFHESLNFAGLHRLPVVFVCENNGLAVNSPLSARHGNACLAGFAGVYGFPGHVIDGTDLDAVLEVARQAVATARRGDGPSLIECRVKRWHGHVGPETDVDRGWQRADELAAWRADCPVRKFRQGMLAQNLADEPTLAAAEAAIDAELRADLAWAREQASPEPADIAQYLFKGAD